VGCATTLISPAGAITGDPLSLRQCRPLRVTIVEESRILDRRLIDPWWGLRA